MTTTATRSNRIIPAQFDIFAGLDVDKKSIAATFSDHGTLSKSLRLPYSATHLLNYVNKHFAEKRIAFVYEAGPTGFGLHDELLAGNHKCLVVTPSTVPSERGRRVKTNRLDSKNLSERLRGGELRGVQVPNRAYRELRHLVQLRDVHTKDLTASKQRIKALLLYEGIEFPEPSGHWNVRAIAGLRQLPCSSEVRFKLDHLIGTLYFHFNSAATVQKRIRQFCKQDSELQRSITLLTSLPGVGSITAAQAVARLGDWRELKNVRQIAGFLGLVSSEHSTGEKVNRGPITRSGDSRLRNKLIQCAWVAIKKDPELRAFYRSVYQRQPKKVAARKAIVAVARKLTTRICVVLKEQRPYIIRPDTSVAPLTTEETVGPRERLDASQNEQL
jgi:transposase